MQCLLDEGPRGSHGCKDLWKFDIIDSNDRVENFGKWVGAGARGKVQQGAGCSGNWVLD